jgi:hypothetical protein
MPEEGATNYTGIPYRNAPLYFAKSHEGFSQINDGGPRIVPIENTVTYTRGEELQKRLDTFNKLVRGHMAEQGCVRRDIYRPPSVEVSADFLKKNRL